MSKNDLRAQWRNVHRVLALRSGMPEYNCMPYLCIYTHTRIYIYIIAQCASLASGWRRPIGCLKLQVTFHKRAANHRALLRKMTCIDR